MTTGAATKSDAKEAFKRLLLKHDGDGAHPEVKEALDVLVELAAKERADDDGDASPEWSPALDADANRGRWRSITTPPFPGKLPDDDAGRSRYTLGRMSFGMFKPTKAVCAVDDIVNVVEPRGSDGGTDGGNDAPPTAGDKADDENAPAWTQTYDIEVLMDVEASSGTKLPAKLTNYGECFPQSSTRLGVKFSKGTLEPRFSKDDAASAAAWKETFEGAVAKEAEARSYLGAAASWAIGALMKAMMGLEPPTDASDFTQTYCIKRPYAGYLDVIYMDGDLRVTRGNKGTVVVTERAT
ncbi:hypothetical protein ACHAWF_013895 [Thalassiosira exigua]